MPTSDTPQAITTCLRLSRAADLARQGKLKAAQAVFGLGSQLPDDPVELQALAALVTREGDFTRALQLWRLLEQKTPGHAEARRMLAAIELWQARPAWYRYLPWVGGAAAALALLALVSVAMSEPPKPKTPPRTTPLVSPVSAAPAPKPQPASPPPPTPSIQLTPAKKKPQR